MINNGVFPANTLLNSVIAFLISFIIAGILSAVAKAINKESKIITMLIIDQITVTNNLEVIS
jgi:hypothetical protein